MRVQSLAALIYSLLFGSVTAVCSPGSSPRGWEELTHLDSNAARNIFAKAQDRESRYGLALSLINSQPRTDATLAAARASLVSLVTENPDDDTGIASAYYLARLHQIHDSKPDPKAAILAYQALLKSHPGHPIAELAAPKLAILLLYEDVPDAVWYQRVDHIETLIAGLQTPAAQRDTRLVLADALLKLHRDHTRALPLIEFCIEENLIVRPPRLGMMLLQAAESARQLHRTPEAIHYYRRYLAEYPRESKTDEIKRRLSRLEQETGV